MRQAVIVSAARTPVGKCRGALAAEPAHELGALVVREAVRRAGIQSTDVEDVLFGNLLANEYLNIARVVSLTAGLPYEVPGFTLDRQCASSLTAFNLAAAMIQSGHADVLVVGGVESDSRRPYVMEKPTTAYQNTPPQWVSLRNAALDEDCIDMGLTAENMAEEFGISREECDAFAAESHRKAAAAWDAGHFDGQIVPVEVSLGCGKTMTFSKDETVRADTTVEALASLRPVFKLGGVVTAGNASPMSDGASALIVMEKERAKALGLPVLGKFVGSAVVGLDPKIMGYGPVPAIRKLMAKTGRTLNDIDLIEMNEAFSVQSLSCIKGLELDIEKLNVNGGAIALGHPLAGTGAILLTKMVHELERSGKQSGIVAFCVGGGQGVAVLIERE